MANVNVQATSQPSTAELQNLVSKLRAENESLLSRLIAAENQAHKHLDMTLNEVSRTNRSIQTSLSARDERVYALQTQIKDLNAERSVSVDESTDISTLSSVHDIKDTNNIETLRRALLNAQQSNEQLRADLEAEQTRSGALRNENDLLKRHMVDLQSSAEMEEEFISNTLIKRIQELQRDKGELLMRVEAEEEMITNQLQKKLQQLQKDKIDIELALEKEQEFMVNRLQKQLDDLRGRLGNGLSVSNSKKWPYSHSNSSSFSELASPTIAPGVVEVLKAEINATKLKLQDTEKTFDEWSMRANALYQRLRQSTLLLLQDHASKSKSDTASTHLKIVDLNPTKPEISDLNLDTFDKQFPPSLCPPKLTTDSSSTSSTSALPIPILQTPTARLSLTGRASMPHRSPSASPIIGQSLDQQHRSARPIMRSSHIN